jgi:hypothetical protein
MTLRDILRQATAKQPDAWLYLPGDVKQWTLDTEAFLLNPEFEDGQDDPILPDSLAHKGLREALDTPTITDCVQWADRLAGRPDDDIRFESFIYYVRFDAFLPKIGAPDPPPPDEIMRRLDAEFYDKLGAEDLTRPCKHDGCSRGAVRFSVLCRRHHFEMIKHRECPFDH